MIFFSRYLLLRRGCCFTYTFFFFIRPLKKERKGKGSVLLFTSVAGRSAGGETVAEFPSVADDEVVAAVGASRSIAAAHSASVHFPIRVQLQIATHRLLFYLFVSLFMWKENLNAKKKMMKFQINFGCTMGTRKHEFFSNDLPLPSNCVLHNVDRYLSKDILGGGGGGFI